MTNSLATIGMVTAAAAAEMTVTDWVTRTLLIMLIAYVYYSARRLINQYDSKHSKHEERISNHEAICVDHTRLFQKLQDSIITREDMRQLIHDGFVLAINNGLGKMLDDRIDKRILDHEHKTQ